LKLKLAMPLLIALACAPLPVAASLLDMAQLTGTLDLDANSMPNALFIFQVGSALTTASSSVVTVLDGDVDSGVFCRLAVPQRQVPAR
jgi:hypothetical protein